MARTCPSKVQQWEALAEPSHYRTCKLAKLFNRPVRELEREFHRQLRRSPQKWLNKRRIRAAKKLLLSGERVKDVASALGFKYVSYFCRFFKSRTGMIPKEFVSVHNPAKKGHPFKPKEMS